MYLHSHRKKDPDLITQKKHLVWDSLGCDIVKDTPMLILFTTFNFFFFYRSTVITLRKSGPPIVGGVVLFMFCCNVKSLSPR